MTVHGTRPGSHPLPWPAQAPHAAGRPSWARAFPGTPGQASPARRFVAGLLEGSPFRDDAVVVLSELFTNAHAPRGALLYPRCSREELKGGSWA